jgi:hypothetical protein
MNKFLLGRPGILLDPKTDNQGGGGGNADDSPASVTEDRVNDIVNKAISRAKKDITKDFQDTIVSTVTGDASPVMKTIGELKTSIDGMKKSSSKDDAKSKGNDDKVILPTEVEERLAKLEKENKAYAAKLQEKEAKEKETAAKQLEDKRRDFIKEKLDKAGFGKRAPYVLAALFNGFSWEDDGSDLGKAVAKNKDGEEMTLDEYIKDFSNSEEGKDLLVTKPRFGTGAGDGEPASYDEPEMEPLNMEADEILKEFDKSKGEF